MMLFRTIDTRQILISTTGRMLSAVTAAAQSPEPEPGGDINMGDQYSYLVDSTGEGEVLKTAGSGPNILTILVDNASVTCGIRTPKM